MIKILVTLLTLIFFVASGQTNVATTKFKQAYFNVNGKISDVKVQSIHVPAILDLEFYKTNFYRPYHFPKQFSNSKYKSQAIIIWNDTTKAKDFESNWTYTYTYDSLSRVTDYNYSGCIICSQLPYRIQIKYDSQNRPLVFQLRHPLNSNETPDEEYFFRYDNKGSIIQIKFFSSGKLNEQIDRI